MNEETLEQIRQDAEDGLYDASPEAGGVILELCAYIREARADLRDYKDLLHFAEGEYIHLQELAERRSYWDKMIRLERLLNDE